MIDASEARTLVEKYLDGIGCPELDLVILDEATEEHSFGWVFFYRGRKQLLCGNAPLIVDRQSGSVVTTGTAMPTEYYARNYEATGNPHAQRGCVVELRGRKLGARKIAAAKSIRNHALLNLAEAKKCVDACLDGNVIRIVARSSDEAELLVTELEESFFSVEQLYSTG
jgi:ribosomal protein L7/L12